MDGSRERSRPRQQQQGGEDGREQRDGAPALPPVDMEEAGREEGEEEGEEGGGGGGGGGGGVELDAELTPEEVMMMQQMGIPFVSCRSWGVHGRG